MKKIVSLAIIVILVCLSLCFSGCSESNILHDELTCPICTKTVDEKYTDLLLAMSILNPDANLETDFMLISDYEELSSLDGIKEKHINIKGVMVPEYPEWVLQENPIESVLYRVDRDQAKYGYRIIHKFSNDNMAVGDVESITVICGALDDSSLRRGGPHFTEWTKAINGFEVTFEYYIRPHCERIHTNDPCQQTLTDAHLINMYFNKDGIEYAINLSLKV